ncbi:MAG: hypothetical protein R2750_09260 [Bacteroidales bacterium]
MEGFSYNNIFDTKGIEYIIIIAFLVLLIPFWVLLNKKSAIVKQVKKVWDVLTIDILKIPQGLFYGRNHTWAYLTPSGSAKVGLDDFLLHVVGDFRIIQLKSPGETIKKGDLLAEINQDGKNLKIVSPLSGKIEKANLQLVESTEVLQNDPYNEGWIYHIRPSNWVGETKSYYLADNARAWIKEEINRFKDFLAVTLNKHSPDPTLVAFQEGGELRSHLLSELDMEIWEDFQKEFLDEMQ